MNIFLFGAGASFGSGEVLPTPPPLGQDLYSVLKRLYTNTWGAFDQSLQYEFNKNFEYGMAKLLEQNSHAIPLLMQQMAVFFARFELTASQGNLYRNLFRRLKAKNLLGEAIISSLNYECICELSAIHEGLQVEYFGSDTSSKAKIWKLHGSCNFILEGITAGRGVSFGAGVSFNGGIKVIEPSEVPTQMRSNTALYPAMALYAKDKPIQIASSTLSELQRQWSEKVRIADKIFVIGVRPLEEDKHIWDSISESNAELYYTGGKDEFDSWAKKFRKEKTNKHLGYIWKESEKAILSMI